MSLLLKPVLFIKVKSKILPRTAVWELPAGSHFGVCTESPPWHQSSEWPGGIQEAQGQGSQCLHQHMLFLLCLRTVLLRGGLFCKWKTAFERGGVWWLAPRSPVEPPRALDWCSSTLPMISTFLGTMNSKVCFEGHLWLPGPVKSSNVTCGDHSSLFFPPTYKMGQQLRPQGTMV